VAYYSTLDLQGVAPLCRVALANDIAYRASWEPWLRAVAYRAAGSVWTNLPRRGPGAIARWVRRHIRYAKECPGIELLQGPRATLSVGVGDCDDLAILWSALCQSIGLPAEVGGVGRFGEYPIHAIGVDPINGALYELSKDGRYSGVGRALRFVLPQGYYCVSWEPRTGHLSVLPAGSHLDGLEELEEECRSQANMLAGLWA